jgi:hypothetical protein
MLIRERAGNLLNLFTQYHTNITYVSPKKRSQMIRGAENGSVNNENQRQIPHGSECDIGKKYKTAASTVIGERGREHVRMSSILPRPSRRRKGRGSWYLPSRTVESWDGRMHFLRYIHEMTMKELMKTISLLVRPDPWSSYQAPRRGFSDRVEW